MIVYWVEDCLSGETLENKYYSSKDEAMARRNELGFGFVRQWDLDANEIKGVKE